MNLVRSVVTNIGLAMLSWVSILFVFATGNLMVVAYAGLLAPDFGWIFLLALLLNIMAGLLVSGIWSGEPEGKWDFIALLIGFMFACICLGALVLITSDNWVFSSVYSHYGVHQAKTLISIPAFTVFGCLLFLWKNEKKRLMIR